MWVTTTVLIRVCEAMCMQHCSYGKKGIHVPDCPFDENVPSNHIADDQLSPVKIVLWRTWLLYRRSLCDKS